ncbi:Protein Jade-1 [Dichanthelium oligosanthes]|uniref:Protein Jade-1 n=1 Tax=Dichanthelium oligosanthes TaxID=888268 RepID=A0A1E5UMA6_9POAL|nr:Protein Jade-1 [Dichanthelium oligosanthes]
MTLLNTQGNASRHRFPANPEVGENSDPSHASVVDEGLDFHPDLGKPNEELESNKVQDMQESSDFIGASVELVTNVESNKENCDQDMQEVIVQQEEQPVEIVLDQGRTESIALPSCREDLRPSLSWLLGSRGRFVLTSERPNKKRKLLGADAGLEQLVLLPSLEGETDSICDVCCLGGSDLVSNRMLHCKNCEISVHQKCYGMHVVPDRFWFCLWCSRNMEMPRRLTRSDACRTVLTPCVLCPKEKGALKPVKRDTGPSTDGGNQEFVHLFCSLWRPEFYVEDMESMEAVTNIVDTQEIQSKLVCSLCKVMHGACVRCSHGACRASFHPICARESKLQIEIWGKFGHDNVEMRAFCAKHSSIRGISSISELDSTQVELHDGKLVTRKEQQQVRFTRSNKDKFLNDTITTSSCSLNKTQTAELATSPSIVGSAENQETRSADMVVDQPTADGNLMCNSGDVSGILRKLVDQGKVSVGDLESELGLCSESLEAALKPETTAFSPDLKLEITTLLQNSLHVPCAQVNSIKEGSLTLQGTLLRSESYSAVAELQSGHEEGISSIDHHCPENDNANKGDLVQNGFQSCPDPDVNKVSGRHLLKYAHPHSVFPSMHANSGFSYVIIWSAVDQVCKAKSSDILEHSPDDEIEGEIVYLQSRLLNGVVSMKQIYEHLILKVVQNISYELDSVNKRKWDHIIVNQFLRDLREAKKRGNSERRHKEALAILAATAPSIAPTPRNATARKDAENKVTSAIQENMPRANAGSSRISQLSSLPQAKDLSFSNSKVSEDTNFGIFDLAKFSKKSALPCDICMRCDSVLNRIFVCSGCKWLLETTFRRGQHNAVDGMERLHKDKDTCSICHRYVGACLKCSTADCQIAFHPSCARDAGLYMNTKRIGNILQHKAYCGKHSIEQRKAYCQQFGPEEVKSMKQMRVELELLRFLCERIVKREKVKKDLIVCAHDILAARRITSVSSMWTSYYASGPGASSESATTSVNNKSYSGTMQRSDDIAVRSDDVTVDSAVTKKHTVRFSLHNRDADRNTADSSTSTISYKRKLDDGESLAFKSLPETPSTALKSDDVEKKPTDKKVSALFSFLGNCLHSVEKHIRRSLF